MKARPERKVGNDDSSTVKKTTTSSFVKRCRLSAKIKTCRETSAAKREKYTDIFGKRPFFFAERHNKVH